MYVTIFPGGVTGWDFMWLGLGFLADISSYAGGYNQRNRIPGYDTTSGGTPSSSAPSATPDSSAPTSGTPTGGTGD